MQCYNFHVKQFLQLVLLQLATVSYFYYMHLLTQVKTLKLYAYVRKRSLDV